MRIIQTISLIIYSLMVVNIHAQTVNKPFDTTINFNDGERACIQVNLEPQPEQLKNAWRKYMKDNYDLKLKGIGFLSNKDLLSKEEVMVKEISSKTMDFYTHIITGENGSEMKVFVRLGYDIYVNKENYPNEYAIIHGIIENFIQYYLPIYYEDEIKVTEKHVKNLSKEKADLLKDIDKKSDKIEKLSDEIKEREEELASNKTRLEETENKLRMRKEKLERIRIELAK